MVEGRGDTSAGASLVLEDHVQRWIVELAPLELSDVCLVILTCDACGQLRCATFRFRGSPSFGGSLEPPFATLEITFVALTRMLGGRAPREITEADWDHARSCPCDASPRRARIDSCTLLRPMLAHGGAALVMVASDVDAPRRLLGELPRGGTATLFADANAASFETRFARPFTLFEPWTELARELATATDEQTLTRALGPDACLIGGCRESLVGAAVTSRGPKAEQVAVLVSRSLVEAHWPAGLVAELADDLVLVLVVRLESIWRALRGLARHELRVGVQRRAPSCTELLYEGLRWPIDAQEIALVMARHGRTLDEACARALEQAVSQIEHLRSVVEAMQRGRPGLEVRVEGTLLTPVRADGREGRNFDVRLLPPDLDPNGPEMARELAFLCDDLAEWSDPSRVCACGAPAVVQTRLVSELAASRFEMSAGQPLAIRDEHTAEAGSTRTLEVVAIACDRHVRLLARDEASRLGLEEEPLRARLDADADRGVFHATVEIFEDENGRRALLARGNLLAGIFLRDGWITALHRAAKEPLSLASAQVAAFTAHTVCVTDPDLSPTARRGLIERARTAGGARPDEELLALRTVDLGVPPEGAVSLVSQQV